MNYLKGSFLLLATAVVLGAFGAHALKAVLNDEQLHTWHTAVEYHVYHALGLLLLCVVPKEMMKPKGLQMAKHFMLAGIFLFCGSIYILSVRSLLGVQWSWLGPITPVGGVCFITAWVIAFFQIRKSD